MKEDIRALMTVCVVTFLLKILNYEQGRMFAHSLFFQQMPSYAHNVFHTSLKRQMSTEQVCMLLHNPTIYMCDVGNLTQSWVDIV